jgi:hypothetical protein
VVVLPLLASCLPSPLLFRPAASPRSAAMLRFTALALLLASALPAPVSLLFNSEPAEVGNYTKGAHDSLLFTNELLTFELVATTTGSGVNMANFSFVDGINVASSTEDAWYIDWSGGKSGNVAVFDTIRIIRVDPTLVEVALADTKHPRRRFEQHIIMTSDVRGLYTFATLRVVAAGECLNEERHNTRW